MLIVEGKVSDVYSTRALDHERDKPVHTAGVMHYGSTVIHRNVALTAFICAVNLKGSIGDNILQDKLYSSKIHVCTD